MNPSSLPLPELRSVTHPSPNQVMIVSRDAPGSATSNGSTLHSSIVNPQPALDDNIWHTKKQGQACVPARRATCPPGKRTRANMTSSRCSTVPPILSNTGNTKDISRRALAPVETSQAETRAYPDTTVPRFSKKTTHQHTQPEIIPIRTGQWRGALTAQPQKSKRAI